MKQFRSAVMVFCLACCFHAQAQQTIGLFHTSPEAFQGYTLFAPLSNFTVYLIDMCGREVNAWPGSYKPGLSAELLEDGTLLRTCKLSSPYFTSGGIGGRIEKMDWDGNILWSYEYASSSYHQHHDIEPLPNGNILVLAWELRTEAECIAAGRDTNYLVTEMWPETVTELRPVGTDSAEVVWQWKMWDHLVQRFDATKNNYGFVWDHPELIHLNFLNSGITDWIHANAIAYNEELDQIVISARNFGELWVIDHGTTTAEAASHSGGRYGKGGDLLYRWGNPAAYQSGAATDQVFFGHHDVRWIPDSLWHGGGFMIFNNGQGRPAGNYSSVDVIVPEMTAPGVYAFGAGGTFSPDSLAWSYVHPDFYSFHISGASRLPNNNTLICEGAEGRLFEIDSLGNIVWEYVNPVTVSGPMTQGDSSALNLVFRTTRYAPDFPGFTGKDLSPGLPIEIDPLPLPASCHAESAEESLPGEPWLRVYPVPASEEVMLINASAITRRVQLTDAQGKRILSVELAPGSTQLNTTHLRAGLYNLLDETGSLARIVIQ